MGPTAEEMGWKPADEEQWRHNEAGVLVPREEPAPASVVRAEFQVKVAGFAPRPADGRAR